MNDEQYIRAMAAQAAASLLAPVSPAPEDYFAVASSIATFIEHGSEAALTKALDDMARKREAVEAAVPAPAPVIEPQPVVDVVAEVAAEPPKEEPQAKVIQLGSRQEPPEKQTAARLSIEKIRKERVNNLMGQASVAKAKVHKQRLVDEAQEAGLDEYTVIPPGATEPTTLGAYLASL
ncbi:hypothetical protein SEA_SATIS_85 [Streptomyces phage Satis]|nr:hypothetical protein SEA_SATIS_85 [Streptomyces phage Satis]QBZ71983.1 hypothetical protein SEA_KRADAL_85 [Streptomyces phage Kradal]QPL14402.1 hypothetical protein SEA_EHYELIMAYOE_85 [Streptomyces phage EhyElimayoE]